MTQSLNEDRKYEHWKYLNAGVQEMNDTTRLILTMVFGAIFLAMVVYGLGLVSEGASGASDLAKR
jgi:hypothetical protein